MKVLIACEESQRVCIEFRKLGHIAFSCDIQECSGGHPEWHIKSDVIPLLDGNCMFKTMDGEKHHLLGKWDLIIAHPPCTYLSHAATQCHSLKCFPLDYINNRTIERINAMYFFIKIAKADCEKIVIENPTGVMNTCYRKPDQTIHPWYFANSENDLENYHMKKTHLWLKGVNPLVYNINHLKPKENTEKWSNGKRKNWTESNHGGTNRSKTFPGIANAMANQWGGKCEK